VAAPIRDTREAGAHFDESAEDLVHLVCRQLPLFHHDLCGCRPRSEKDERAPSMRVVGEEWRFYPIRAMRGGMLISILSAGWELRMPSPQGVDWRNR
jgi:hypothetical protein